MTLQLGSLIWYTDRSRTDGRSGADVRGARLRKMLSLSPGVYTTAFQAEICVNLDFVTDFAERIYTRDNQAASRALEASRITSKLAWKCRQTTMPCPAGTE
jgi:hypothetical protein